LPFPLPATAILSCNFFHPGRYSHVKDLTHFSGVPNAAQLIAKKPFYYPVAETRLSACFFLSAYLLSDFRLQIASNAIRYYRNTWVTPGKLQGAPLVGCPLALAAALSNKKESLPDFQT
jgi:hypothetical protein